MNLLATNDVHNCYVMTYLQIYINLYCNLNLSVLS